MEPPPVPKPRTLNAQGEPKKPVPLPRTKLEHSGSSDKVSASDLLRSIGTASRQLTDEVAEKVQKSAKSANEKIEKSFADGTKFAKDGLEKTRHVRDTLTRSVVEGTRSAGLKLRSSTRRLWEHEAKKQPDGSRCTSMPAVDVSLFENLQFHSPLQEQKRFNNTDSENNDILPMNLNCSNFDDLSIFSSHSDTNTDTVSDLSFESRDHEGNMTDMDDVSQTYDTPVKLRRNAPSSPERLPPEPAERFSTSDRMSFLRQNSLYENWNLPTEPLLPPSPKPRPSQSTIYEFDPLKMVDLQKDGKSNQLLLLESFLNGDTYGRLGGNNLDSDESLNTIGEPPTPPERFDSLPLEGSSDSESAKKGTTSWFTDEEPTTSVELDVRAKSTANTSVMKRFSNILKFDTTNKSGKEKEKLEIVERPLISKLPVVSHSGLLTRNMSGGMDDLFKQAQPRYCVLSDQKLLCYTDPTSSVLKESFSLLNINSVQISLMSHSSTHSNSTPENYYCFEVNVSCGNVKIQPSRKIVFSCNSGPERRTWVQKFVEHLSDGFPEKYSSELTRFGWGYVREGVGAQWCGAWMMLIRRILVYYTNKDRSIKTVDLRKTQCILTQDVDEVTRLTCPTDGSPSLLLDNPGCTLYLRFPNQRELKSWRYIIKLVATNNGAYIHHQQLTREDVPVIVDKCINFIYVHGSMTEGIYRRAGSSATVAELLTRFRRDAWSVRLSKSEHTEHDVSTALKRFFRDLPESLIPQDLHDRLVEAGKIGDASQRCVQYSRLLQDMPSVSRQSARKLFQHLHLIHTLSDTNKMNAENLASVWAPTIMPAALTSNSLQTAWSAREVSVVRDLISLFPAIFKPSNAELERERTMLAILHRVANSSAPAPHQPRSAGDLRVWIYLNEYADGRCENVALTPSKTCEDICVELTAKMGTEPHQLMLEEVVLNGALRRIVPYSEVALDVVLRWGYWDDDDRKDNYLLLKDNKLLQEMEALRGTTSLVCGELRYAGDKAKTFKPHMFELHSSKLSYFKDKQGSSVMGEWQVKEYLWYVGFEPKRNPHSRWAITFIPRSSKPNRSKDHPYFGSTIAGTVTEDQLRWLAALAFAQTDGSILLTPRLIIT